MIYNATTEKSKRKVRYLNFFIFSYKENGAKQMENKTIQLYKKKGQAAGAVNAIITLVVGIGVAVMVLIFVGALGGQTYQLVEADIDTLYSRVINQTFTPIFQTPVYLSYRNVDTTGFEVINSTNSEVIGTGNYTMNFRDGLFNLTAVSHENATMAATFYRGNQTVESSIKDGIISAFSALEQTGDYLPIVVLAVIISLVLALVLSFTAFGNVGSGSRSVL